MAIYAERNNISILDSAVDPEGDPLTVTEINGNPAYVGAPVTLSVGGSITVQADGSASFDDTGYSWPAQGASQGDSVIATVSDGMNPVFVTVNIMLNHL